VTSPTGGPKDEDPPKLLSSVPKQGQTNYNGTQMMLEFDEFLKLKNPKDEIIITPDVKNIKYSTKKNLMLIDIDEKLQENTTYSLAFRESIQDLNEGNPAEDLHLAFSTGNIIDSLEISGNVTQLLKGLPSEKYTVAIYESDTFNIFKHRSLYFTRTNKKGEFKIQNLKPGAYFIYTFEDKNKNLVLDSKTEKFGFKPDYISLHANIDSLQLNTIALDSRSITIAGIRALGHFTKVRLNKNLTNYSITSLDSSDSKIRHSFSASQAEIDIYPNKPLGDSTQIKFLAYDSLNQFLDSTFYIKQTDAKSLKEKITLSLVTAQVVEETQKFYAEINSSTLIKQTFPDSLFIQIDSTRSIPFAANEIKYDTIFRSIRIEKTFQKKDSIKWKQAKLVMGQSSFISIHGDSSKRILNPIALISADETATLIIESLNTNESAIIEVLDDRYQLLATSRHSKHVTIKNLKPVTIMLRAIIDENKNGKWDPGNPHKKTPPERIIFYSNELGKQQIPLRANWEVNVKLNF
jgi:uncharacterized protein (DUF2141 family)